MSQNMVEKLKRQMSAKNIISYFIFGAIILVFVLFGFQGKHSTLGVGSAARVNSELISLHDFESEVQRVQQYYASLFGGIDLSSQRQLMGQQALENLVRYELVAQTARKEGILATDAEVRDFIVKDIPFFQQNGQFQRELYSRYLEATRSNPGDFESKLRKEILSLRSRHFFEIVGHPTQSEMNKTAQLRENKMNILVAGIEQPKAEAALAAGLIAQAKEKLKDAEFLKKTEAEFNLTKAQYEQREEVKASHILIAAKAGDEAAEQKALQKIKEIQKRVQKEDFGKVAAEVSEDPGSKKAKGDLGFFGRGAMTPEFEKVAFELKPGQLSEPVKTPFGYHLIKVIAKKEAKEARFENLKDQVAARILAKEEFEKQIKSLDEALAQSDEAKVGGILKALGVSWEESGYFDLLSESIPKVQSTSAIEYVAELSQKKPLLPRLIREGNLKYVLKLKDMKKESSQANAKEDSVELQQRRRSDSLYQAWLNQARKQSSIEMNSEVLKR